MYVFLNGLDSHGMNNYMPFPCIHTLSEQAMSENLDQ